MENRRRPRSSRISFRISVLRFEVGGNIGTPILALPPPAPERVHVDRMLFLSNRSCALAQSLRRRAFECHAGSSGSTWHDGKLRGDQGAAGTEGRSRGRWTSTTTFQAQLPVNCSGPAARRHASRSRGPTSKTALFSTARSSCAGTGAARHRLPILPGSARYAARTMARMPPPPSRRSGPHALDLDRVAERFAELSGPAASPGGGRPAGEGTLYQRFEGHQC